MAFNQPDNEHHFPRLPPHHQHPTKSTSPIFYCLNNKRTALDDMPPRKSVKRTNSVIAKDTKPIKKIRKELDLRPDLRHVDAGGVMLAFGQGDVGQLGLGEEVMEKMRPAAITGYTDIIAIAAGGMHTIGLTKTGTVITFGCNDEGALGRDTSKEGSETEPGVVELDGKVIQVTAGDSHSAALTDDGRVFAWGSFRDSHGSMGLTTKGTERLPVELLPELKIVKISSGVDHLVMLTANGKIYTCGCAEQGQLGRVPARKADRHCRQGIAHLLAPGLVELKLGNKYFFSDIWAGQYCTFAKEQTDGKIYTFGLNNFHQLGLEDPVPYYHYKVATTFNGKEWTHISSGQHHTVALDKDGDAYVLGRKEYGRLGLGENCNDATKLTRVEGLPKGKIIDVATGSAQTFAVTDEGQLYSWGMGTNGQLGTGDSVDIFTPTLVKGKQLEGKTVVRAAGGGQHTIILAVPNSIKANGK